MYIIAAANGMRSLVTLVDLLYVHVYSLPNALPGKTSQLVFLALPSLVTFTMYSLLTAYFAQLCYTVMGMPFFHVRNSWFLSNVALYFLVLFGLFVYVNSSFVCGSLAFAFGINFLVAAWFGMNLFKNFPPVSANASGAGGGNFGIGGRAGNSGNSGNTPHVQQVRTRLTPLVSACTFGLFADSALYFRLLLVDPDITTQVIGTAALIMCSEILPATAFLWVVSKRENDGESASLLTATVAAAGRLPTINWYNAVEMETLGD